MNDIYFNQGQVLATENAWVYRMANFGCVLVSNQIAQEINQDIRERILMASQSNKKIIIDFLEVSATTDFIVHMFRHLPLANIYIEGATGPIRRKIQLALNL